MLFKTIEVDGVKIFLLRGGRSEPNEASSASWIFVIVSPIPQSHCCLGGSFSRRRPELMQLIPFSGHPSLTHPKTFSPTI
jgi:hypothetical protein